MQAFCLTPIAQLDIPKQFVERALSCKKKQGNPDTVEYKTHGTPVVNQALIFLFEVCVTHGSISSYCDYHVKY